MALLAIWDEDGAHIHAVPPPVATVAVDVAPEAWRAWKSVVIRGLDGCTVQATGRRIVALGLVSRTMLVDPDTHRVIAELNQGAEHVAFSPRGSYVSTWRTGAFAERRPAAAPGSAARTTTVDFRLSDPKLAGQMQTVRSVFSRGEEVEIVGGATEPDEPSAIADADASAPSVASKEDKENLSIWRVSDGALLASFSQRNKERWAPQWTDDELVCIRTVNNTVQIFRNGDFGPGGRTVLTVERIGRASLAPCGRPSYRGKTGGTRPLLATFVPENKATPASVKLVSLNENNAAVAAKTFFQAREAEMHWSPKGTDVVVNASILNASSLYLVAEQASVRIELPSTYVHDIAWSPDGRQFVVVHGPPTAKLAWLLDRRGQRSVPHRSLHLSPPVDRLADLGGNSVSRSIASFSQSGERLLLAGLYGTDNQVQLWQLGPKPTLVLSKSVGSVAVCALLDSRGTQVLIAGTDRFPSQNGYRVVTDAGVVVAEHSVRKLKSCTPLLPASAPGGHAALAGPASSAASPAMPAAGGADGAHVPRDELEKRLKAVTKKLKQLEPLKEKQRLGMVLEENQIAKLQSEAAWTDEVALLTSQLAASTV